MCRIVCTGVQGTLDPSRAASSINSAGQPTGVGMDANCLPSISDCGRSRQSLFIHYEYTHNRQHTPTRTTQTQKREGQHLAHVTLASFLCSQHATRTALTDTFHACERFLLVLHSHRLSLFVNSGYVTSFAAIIYHILICDREKVRRRLRNNRGPSLDSHCAYPAGAAPGWPPHPYRSYSLALHASYTRCAHEMYTHVNCII